MNDLLRTTLEAVTQHVPTGAAWVPLVTSAAAAAFGLLLLVKGAKLAPYLAALTFALCGGIAGSFFASWANAPPWPVIGGIALVGFFLGLVLFKFWMATLVATCFIIGSLTLYGGKVLQPYLVTYTADNYDHASGLVTLPDPAQVVGPTRTAASELQSLWSYLATNVPSFPTSFWAIVISTGLAGAVFGLLLPKLSRALWAASTGMLVFLLGLSALLETIAPNAAQWLASLGPWTWFVVLGVWAASLAYNVFDCSAKRPRTKPAPEEPQPSAAPA